MAWHKSTLAMIFLIGFFALGGCVALRPIQTTQELIPQTQKEAFFQAVQKTNWLVTVSIIGISISIFAFINGNRGAMAAAVACFVCLSISLAVARYATFIALVGTGVSLVLSGYTIFIKNKALREIVKEIQEFKEDVPVWSIKDYLNKQSKTTKEIVKKIKGKI